MARFVLETQCYRLHKSALIVCSIDDGTYFALNSGVFPVVKCICRANTMDIRSDQSVFRLAIKCKDDHCESTVGSHPSTYLFKKSIIPVSQ